MSRWLGSFESASPFASEWPLRWMTLDSLGNRPSKLANPIPVRSHLISRRNHKNFEVSNRCFCRSHSNGVISGALVLVPNLDFFLGSARSFPGFRFTNNADSAVSQLRAGFPAGLALFASCRARPVHHFCSLAWDLVFLLPGGMLVLGDLRRSPPFRPPSQPTRVGVCPLCHRPAGQSVWHRQCRLDAGEASQR